MKKVLFVLFKKYCGILEGGGIANKRNLSIAQRILGNKNVDVVYIHDEGKGGHYGIGSFRHAISLLAIIMG